MIDCHFRLERQGFQLDVQQQLPGQGVSVLFGHSGSGKTTWLRCIAGLERAQHAFLSVNGEVWEDSQKHLYRPPYKRALGYVFQEASLFPHLNVQQNLTFGYKRVKPTPPASYLQQMIELLGIEHLLNHQPKQLSGGERQRVAIARALAVQPALLLMDEPLASLDLKRRQEILPFLTQLHNELAIPVVYVTHSPQEVNRLADYLVLLEQGKIIAAGGLEETLTRMDIQMAYSRQASTVLRVQVISHEDEVYLTRAGSKDFSLYLPYQQHAPIGSAIRLRIYARDVSLALEPPKNSSILNNLATQIQAIRDGEPGQVVVQLKLGEKTLLSHITKKSALRLGLEVGQPIFAQIKATAIL